MAVGDGFKKLPTHGAALSLPVPSAVMNANHMDLVPRSILWPV